MHLRSQQATRARLTFVAETGSGVAMLPVWDYPRTCIIDLASHPAPRGKLKLLELSFPSGGAQRTAIEGYGIIGGAERYRLSRPS